MTSLRCRWSSLPSPVSKMSVIPSRQLSTEDNALLLIDLGKGSTTRWGATALAQVYRQLGDKPADVRDVAQLESF